MSETRYLISEAAKLTQTEAHVLRYWEEELQLPIGRNEMGHRYYTEKDIRTFQSIKELKKKGLQLRAIRDMLHQQEARKSDGTVPKVVVMKPQRFSPVEEKREKEPESRENLIEKEKAAEKSKEEQFEEIMERLIRDIGRNERKEGRYRRLDEAIRRHQQSRRLVAATEETGDRRKRSIRKKIR